MILSFRHMVQTLEDRAEGAPEVSARRIDGMEDAAMPSAGRFSPTGRVVDVCCLAFAAWTVSCNAVVLAEGSLVDLLRLTGLLLPVLAAGLLIRRRRPGGLGDWCESQPQADAGSPGAPVRRLGVAHRAGLLAAGVLTIASYPVTGSFTLFWWLFAAYFAVATAITMRQPIERSAAAASRRQELALLGLGVLCATATLLAHRPDNDDVFYVNLAVGAADHPEMPLLKYENIHGIPGQRINAFYRVTSIEVLAGAVSYLSGISAVAVSHWGIATFAGFLVPLAYGRLFRTISGRGWVWAVAGAMVFLLIDGSAHANYGNLAFVRLYQGKCIFLSVVAPGILAYALRFSSRPTARRWLLLSASLIAGSGLTSSAVWAGPALAGLALIVAWAPTRRGLARFAAGASAAFYPLTVGLVLKLGAGVHAGSRFSSVSKVTPLDLPEQAFLKVFDDNLAPLSIAMLAWLLVKPGLGSRVATVFPLGCALVLSPYAAPWVALHLTGIWTYWRVFWLLPLPALVGLAVIGCRQHLGRARAERLVGYVALLALAASLFPTRYTLSRANGVEIKLPALKMPPAYDYVEMVNRSVAPGSFVLAPPEISHWMTIQNRHAHPLISIPKYLQTRLAPDEFERRVLLTAYVSGRPRAEIPPEALRWSLKHYNLAGVCLDVRAPWVGEIRDVLTQEGYRKTVAEDAYEMWTLAR